MNFPEYLLKDDLNLRHKKEIGKLKLKLNESQLKYDEYDDVFGMTFD